MVRRSALLISLLTLCFASGLSAADHGEIVAGCCDEETIAVVHIRLDEIETDDLVDQLKDLIELEDVQWAHVAGPLQAVDQLKRQFAEMGCLQITAIVRPSIGNDALQAVAVDLKADTNTQGVSQLLRMITGSALGEAEFQIENTLVMGALQPAAEELSPRQAEIANQLRGNESSALQLIAIPSGDHRRVFREFTVGIPDDPGAEVLKLLVTQFESLTLSLEISPALDVSMRIRESEADAAALLLGKLNDLVSLLMKEIESAEEGELALSPLSGQEMRVWMTVFQHTVDSMSLVENTAAIELRASSADGSLAELAQAAQPLVETFVAQQQRVMDVNSLKQLAIAMHNYHDVHKMLPGRFNVDDDEQPLLSWRVALLPYLGEFELYQRFHLDEPWDSPHNISLLDEMPELFASDPALRAEGKTRLVVIDSPEALFNRESGRSLGDITDGLSNTIMIARATPDHAVAWTKPDDLGGSWEDIHAALTNAEGQQTYAHANGAVTSESWTVEQLKAMITFAGKEIISR